MYVFLRLHDDANQNKYMYVLVKAMQLIRIPNTSLHLFADCKLSACHITLKLKRKSKPMLKKEVGTYIHLLLTSDDGNKVPASTFNNAPKISPKYLYNIRWINCFPRSV